MARLSSGIQVLDDLIEGGFREGSINLVVGEPGSGKSTLAVQFLQAGFKAGEAGLYVSVEEDKEKFFANMKNFGFDLEQFEKSGKLTFHKETVSDIRGFLDQGLISLEQYINTGNVKRVVLDSITALLLAYSAETAQRNAVLSLFDILLRYGVTVVITSEADDGKARFGVEYLVDGIIRLNTHKLSQERVTTLEVYKMRGTNHSRKEFVYRLEKGGLKIYPDEKILM
jgi:KaiC/GvpD/RAD55 family RecA-like ATPase